MKKKNVVEIVPTFAMLLAVGNFLEDRIINDPRIKQYLNTDSYEMYIQYERKEFGCESNINVISFVNKRTQKTVKVIRQHL